MRAVRGLRAVGVLDIAGYVLAAATTSEEPVTLDELGT